MAYENEMVNLPQASRIEEVMRICAIDCNHLYFGVDLLWNHYKLQQQESKQFAVQQEQFINHDVDSPHELVCIGK